MELCNATVLYTVQFLLSVFLLHRYLGIFSRRQTLERQLIIADSTKTLRVMQLVHRCMADIFGTEGFFFFLNEASALSVAMELPQAGSSCAAHRVQLLPQGLIDT